MVVADLDGIGLSFTPGETDSPLVVDADAVLSGPFARKAFEAVAGRHTKVVEALRRLDHAQFALGLPMDVRGQPPRTNTPRERFRFAVAE